MGIVNLLVSFNFLVETKGVNLDKVKLLNPIEMQTMNNNINEAEAYEKEKMILDNNEKP